MAEFRDGKKVIDYGDGNIVEVTCNCNAAAGSCSGDGRGWPCGVCHPCLKAGHCGPEWAAWAKKNTTKPKKSGPVDPMDL